MLYVDDPRVSGVANYPDVDFRAVIITQSFERPCRLHYHSWLSTTPGDRSHATGRSVYLLALMFHAAVTTSNEALRAQVTAINPLSFERTELANLALAISIFHR